MNRLKLKQMLQHFFYEDIGERDVTSEAIFSNDDEATAVFTAKEDGIVAGTDVIEVGYALLHERIACTLYKRDGDIVRPGEPIAVVCGPIIPILSGERVILNLLQRMSGIATLTNEAVRALNSHHTRICDTRKTTPGLRMLEKYAVTCGGGYNHRFGLYDAIMIKDNHIAHCGSIRQAVERVRATLGHMVKIEVETETKEQVVEAVEAGVDVIMFDNRTPEEIAQFMKLVPRSITTEASGGITLENIAEYGKTGVDYISLGMLTHSAKALDISLHVQ